MRIGVGLPSGLAGTSSQLILQWAKQADEGPFSSVGVIDRLAYDSFEPLTTLAAVASITQRVKLATTIVIGPLHNDALLAKTAATVDALSQGRLILGLAVGARREDYEVAGIDYRSRGRRLTEQLITLRSLWEDSPIGPKMERQRGPDLLIGGLSDQGYARMARYADGYVHGGGPPRVFARGADKARAAWGDMGRPGKPQIWAQAYFALGDDTEIAAGYAYMREYYSFAGSIAERIASWMLTTPQEIAGFLRGYEEAGCDDLVLFPTIPHISQLERLADALVSLGRSEL